MPTNPSLLKTVRQVHLYFGVFIAPALLFFAFTGFVQTFSLHETTRGSNYQPPKILVELGQLHKKQTLVVPERRPPAEKPRDTATPASHAPDPTPKPGPQPKAPQKNLWPMKLFFALVSIGLFTSTLTGLYMAYTFIRHKPLVTGVLVAGIVIPILLTFV